MRFGIILCALAAALSGATTIDRIVAVVGKRAIKQSDVERDMRVTQFLNNEAPALGVSLQKQSLERLIDQELIRGDMASAGNTGHLDSEAKALSDQLLRDRFAGSQPKLDAELQRRGLTEQQLLQQLQWQLIVLRFIDQRFRPGVIVGDDEVRKYYDEHKDSRTFDAAAPEIWEKLEAQGVDRNFEEWLTQARKTAIVQYKVDALK